MSDIQTISATQLAQDNSTGNVDIIDVRTPLEYREVCAVSARNVPLDVLDPHAVIENRRSTSDAPIYVICKSGARGAKACQKFIDAGITNVINVDGGTEAWVAAGLPVPALSAGLSWFDTARQGTGTANLIQAQRDAFGVHGFERIDAPGIHHGEWSKDAK